MAEGEETKIAREPQQDKISLRTSTSKPDDGSDVSFEVEQRRQQEEAESIELARALMAEEAMASYEQHFTLFRDDFMSDEDRAVKRRRESAPDFVAARDMVVVPARRRSMPPNLVQTLPDSTPRDVTFTVVRAEFRKQEAGQLAQPIKLYCKIDNGEVTTIIFWTWANQMGQYPPGLRIKKEFDFGNRSVRIR